MRYLVTLFRNSLLHTEFLIRLTQTGIPVFVKLLIRTFSFLLLDLLVYI